MDVLGWNVNEIYEYIALTYPIGIAWGGKKQANLFGRWEIGRDGELDWKFPHDQPAPMTAGLFWPVLLIYCLAEGKVGMSKLFRPKPPKSLVAEAHEKKVDKLLED